MRLRKRLEFEDSLNFSTRAVSVLSVVAVAGLDGFGSEVVAVVVVLAAMNRPWRRRHKEDDIGFLATHTYTAVKRVLGF